MSMFGKRGSGLKARARCGLCEQLASFLIAIYAVHTRAIGQFDCCFRQFQVILALKQRLSLSLAVLLRHPHRQLARLTHSQQKEIIRWQVRRSARSGQVLGWLVQRFVGQVEGSPVHAHAARRHRWRSAPDRSRLPCQKCGDLQSAHGCRQSPGCSQCRRCSTNENPDQTRPSRPTGFRQAFRPSGTMNSGEPPLCCDSAKTELRSRWS